MEELSELFVRNPKADANAHGTQNCHFVRHQDPGRGTLTTGSSARSEARVMRLFRLRFTIRRIMVVVALVAMLLGLERMWARRAYCLERAKWHSMQEAGFRGESDGYETEAGYSRKTGDFAEMEQLEAQSMEYRHESEHQARLKGSYEHVSAHPWIPLPIED
jgi:hypothetical protein